MKKITFFASAIGCMLICVISDAQMQFFSYPADTAGWVVGSDHSDYRAAHYYNDTFVVTTSTGGENNYIYNTIPVSLFGAGSVFTASFDFRIDSNMGCSDGLTFWFFTSSLSQLGCICHEGGDLGFPDTTSGFALAFRTIGCVDEIYMKKISSNSYCWCGGTGSDTNICPYLPSETFLTDGSWHHCSVSYNHGNIATSFDGGTVTMSGYNAISGTGHFGFMGTNGGGYSRKCLKNIQINASLGSPTDSTDSFGVYINKMCNGPQITVQTHSYSPTYHVKTWYGDGSSDYSSISSGLSGSGYAVMSHTYQSAGHYNIKQVLYNGASPIDSLHFSYENLFCATLPVKFYYDANSNCIKDGTDPYVVQPVTTEVDSNGVAIDTISSTSGFYYNTQGHAGDIYSFKVLSVPGNMNVSCPSTGIIKDTLMPGVFIAPVKYVGLNCSGGPGFDLAVNAVIPVTGIHDQWGDVYVNNAFCAPTNGTLTLHYSPKYSGAPCQVSPTPTSMSGSTIVWDLSALTSISPGNTHLHYQVNYSSTTLTIGDTVHSYFVLTPTTSDANPANNTCIIIDTIRAGCDPNEMSVTPNGCIPPGVTQLQYTINFENTGNDTAFNIYVMDTLSDYVDAHSLKIVTTSVKEMYISKFTSGGHNIVRFDFPYINLLDSSHHNLCNGTVWFTVNTNAGLAAGTKIFNHAGIFFDDNAVVMTDTVENRIDCPTASGVPVVNSVNSTQLYPNPAGNELTIKTNQNSYTSFTVTNTMGQPMLQQPINATQTNVSLKKLPAGVYYISLKGENGYVVRKFVKM